MIGLMYCIVLYHDRHDTFVFMIGLIFIVTDIKNTQNAYYTEENAACRNFQIYAKTQYLVSRKFQEFPTINI